MYGGFILTFILHSNLLFQYLQPGVRITRRVPLVEQELLTLPEHLSSPPVFCGARVARSLILCVWFVDRCMSFFCWPLRCLPFLDLRILITRLVSSNSSSIAT